LNKGTKKRTEKLGWKLGGMQDAMKQRRTSVAAMRLQKGTSFIQVLSAP